MPRLAGKLLTMAFTDLFFIVLKLPIQMKFGSIFSSGFRELSENICMLPLKEEKGQAGDLYFKSF